MGNNINERGKISLNATQIKTIAIIAMLIDHIAWSFVDKYSLLGQIMHLIGRLTAPIMCFFIAQGYLHTKSVKKYLGRLVIFSFISHFPYVLEATGKLGLLPFSVIYTLTLGLLAILAYDKIPNKFLRWLAIIGIGILSLQGDWMFFGIAFCLVFYIYRDSFQKQCVGIISIGIVELVLMALTGMDVISNLFQMGIILSLPILYLYNKEKGGNKYSGWIFYIFYPLHLLIIGLISVWIS